MDALPLPSSTRRLVSRIAATAHPDDLFPPPDQISTAFVVTLVDSLHASTYATFLSISYANELARKFDVDIAVDFTIRGAHWTFNSSRGLPHVSAHHVIDCSFDGRAQRKLSRIGTMALMGEISPELGLACIAQDDAQGTNSRWELMYRDFPGRGLVVPFMACGTSAVCFGGTYIDAAFSSLAGLVAGFVHQICGDEHAPRALVVTHDFIVATTVSFYSVMAITLQPEHTCFQAQTLGALFWFFYGTAYITSLFEMTSGQLKIGVMRCLLATMHSFVLALGVAFGAVIATLAHGRSTRSLIIKECIDAESQIDDWLWGVFFFLVLATSFLMQLRLDSNDFGACILVMAVARGAVYLSEILVGPSNVFLLNMIPSLFASIATFLILQFRNNRSTFGTTASSPARTAVAGRGSKYDYRDAWFCLFPSLYLLVPGSGLVKASLFSIAHMGGFEHGNIFMIFQAILSAGFGQVVGVRAGNILFSKFGPTRYRPAPVHEKLMESNRV